METDVIRSYHTLFDSSGEPLLYSHPWWLDATCGAGLWSALISYDAEQRPLAAIPFQQIRIRSLASVTTPPLTQWVSLIAAENDSAQENALSLSGLPKTPILDLSIKPDQRIPLEHLSIAPALKYSFMIPRSGDIQHVRARYNEGLRRNLKQATQLHAIEESDNLQGFLDLCHQTYRDRHIKPPPWFNTVIPRVYKELTDRKCGTLSIATANDKIIAGVLTAWDSHNSYYLAGGKVSDEHGTAAHALLLDHAIRDACARGTAFDFEGSMNPGIANFFQSFGAVPISYWHFKKYHGAGRLWSVLKK